jgi:GMP synthase-like glutamine amidotransferase
VRVDLGEPLPGPEAVSGAVVLGATPAVFDPAVAWVAGELDWLRRADAAALPVLGICFGAQALTAALGGQVRAAARPEIGWIDIGTAPFAPGPWLAWHRDITEPPPGARRLAANDVCVQAFELGPHLAVQFHPEVTAEIVEAWTLESPAELGALCLDGAALVAESRRHEEVARGHAFELFDSYRARITR